MPTLNQRNDPSNTIHPRQTELYIKAKPPEVGNITYQVDQRAVQFLTETRDYEDGDDLPWSLVHVLRQVRDLFTIDEGRPRDPDPDEFTAERVTVPTLDEREGADLVQYLRNHPDISGDIGAFETRLREHDKSYVDAISREGYTPNDSPGFDETGNETLDRIAEQYFGDGTQEYIEWNDDRVYDYIVVADRNGDSYQFPRIESRIPEGEKLRLSQNLYERWGPEIGAADVNSRRYETDEDGFPNRWIGQREGAPEPSLEQAESPRAFFYRTIAGRSNYAPGKEAEEAFEDACEYSLEVYKANFPTAVDPRDLQTEYAVIEEATEPWNDFQVPPRWTEEYSDTGGLPPLERGPRMPERFDEQIRDAIDRRTAGGSGDVWFDSVDDAIERFDDPFYQDILIAADQINYPVRNFRRGGTAQPIFEVSFHSKRMVLDVLPEKCHVTVVSTIGGTHSLRSTGTHLTQWNLPDTDIPEASHEALAEQAHWFDEVAEIVETFMAAMEE